MSTSTQISSKGQVVLPKSLRTRRGWEAGTRLSVIETEDGVLLKPAKRGEASRLEDVAGSLRVKGPARSLADMDAGIAKALRRRL